MKLLGISGTITGSKTEILVKEVLKKVESLNVDIEVELLNLKDYDVQFCDGRDPSTYTGDTKSLIDKVSSADFYIIGTPIFQGSITGALKNVFDLVPISALRSKVMGFVATGGTFQHYLVIENQLKPIAGYFRAYVAPGYVYAHDSHFNEVKEITDEDVLTRIESLAEEVVFMQNQLKGTTSTIKS
ncbi:NADPH-dependent FMN reductase [Alkalihalobacillus deserti]|uniref:NADPH-dependent FMN reductase n=1 Tax=Alkalihalobacillus deserti TaxID=2879466 RepID=UPI001D138015|nr:NADPH-dependent FMN reductase [Alkalihalobacillus deserti]